MAQPRLKAVFFASTDGVVIKKAPILQYAQRRRIYDRDKGICQKCRAKCMFGGNTVSPFDTIASSAIDHIFPRSRGGQNLDENLRLLCMSCNSAKGAK